MRFNPRQWFIHTCDLWCQLFSPCNCKNWVHNPLLNFSVPTKADQIASVNAPTKYTTNHYSTICSRNSSRLINRRCEWTPSDFQPTRGEIEANNEPPKWFFAPWNFLPVLLLHCNSHIDESEKSIGECLAATEREFYKTWRFPHQSFQNDIPKLPLFHSLSFLLSILSYWLHIKYSHVLSSKHTEVSDSTASWIHRNYKT